MGGCSSDLDCRVTMQPKPDGGIIINFITNTMHSFSRDSHLPLLCQMCAAGSSNNLGQSCRRDEVWKFWNTDSRHIQWGSGVGEESSWCDTLLWWELKTCVLKREDLRTGEVGTNLDRPNWGNMRFLIINKDWHDPFPTRTFYTTLDVVWAKDEFYSFLRLECVMMSYTGVGRRMGVLIIGDDSCGAFLLRANMISPTRLPRGMRYAGNMPKRASTLVSCTAVTRWKPIPARECTWTSCTHGEDSSMIVGSGTGWDRVTRFAGGREKLTVSGRWVSPSSPIGVSVLRLCDPNTSASSRCGSRVQNSYPPGMSSNTFCNTVGSPVRWARR